MALVLRVTRIRKFNSSMKILVVPLSKFALLLATDPTPGQESKTRSDGFKGLIEQVLLARSQDEQQAAFDAILGLGCSAIPAIAAALGDNRTLPIRYLRLKNESPAAFEAFRPYGPETITDGLAAILNQVTNRSFGSIYNGASAEQ
jgi:hypothetical protein